MTKTEKEFKFKAGLRIQARAECAAKLADALWDIAAECPHPVLPYGKRINEIAIEALTEWEKVK